MVDSNCRRVGAYRVESVAEPLVDRAFGVLQATARWLHQRGLRQRIADIRRATYEQWQAAGVNYAVFRGDRLVGVFSLPRETFSDWTAFADQDPALWLRALATHPDQRGQGTGEFAVQKALEIAGSGQPLWLDCVTGFLPGYYARLGFEILARRVCPDGEGQEYQIALMRHANRQGLDKK